MEKMKNHRKKERKKERKNEKASKKERKKERIEKMKKKERKKERNYSYSIGQHAKTLLKKQLHKNLNMYAQWTWFSNLRHDMTPDRLTCFLK